MSTRDYNKKSEITGVIDLSRLPPPEFVDDLPLDQIESDLKAKFREIAARRNFTDYSLDADDPASWIIEVMAYESQRVRKRTNNQSRLVMPAYSNGPWLDNVLSSFGAPKRVEYDEIDPLTGQKIRESDEAYLRRALLSPDQYSTTGCDAAYEYLCLKIAADPANKIPLLKHVKPSKKDGSGDILVSLLFDIETMRSLAKPDAEKERERIKAVFTEFLNSRNVRNINEEVFVDLAEVVDVPLGVANLYVPPGVSPEVIRLQAVEQMRDYAARSYEIGGIISISGIHTASTAPGVYRVELKSFKEDVLATASQALFLSFAEGKTESERDIKIVQVSR